MTQTIEPNKNKPILKQFDLLQEKCIGWQHIFVVYEGLDTNKYTATAS